MNNQEEHNKQQGAILTHEWIGKAIWAIAGFFLIATYNEVKENVDSTQEIMRQNARIESRQDDFGTRIERLETKMDLYDQNLKDFYRNINKQNIK